MTVDARRHRSRRSYPSTEAPDRRARSHGPLLPEQILVLTYNVKAARELGERIETAVGAGDARSPRRQQLPQLLPSGAHRVGRRRGPARRNPTSSTASASSSSCATSGRDLAARLPRRRRQPDLLARPVRGLHQPRQGRARHAGRLRRPSSTASARPSRSASDRMRRRSSVSRPWATSHRCARSASATPTSDAQSGPPRPDDEVDGPDFDAVEKVADREARRTIAGDGSRPLRGRRSSPTTMPRIDALARDLRRRRRRARGPAPVRARARLPRLPGGAGARAAPSTSASRSAS